MNENAKHIAKRILWIVLGFCLAGLSIAAVELKKSMFITGIEVDVVLLEEGNNLVTAEDILLDIAQTFGPVENIPVQDLDAQRMEEVLIQNSFMKKVDVYVDAHQKLHVRVEQREPMMRIMDPESGDYYLDKEGVRIPVSRHYTVRVPITSGNVPAMEEPRISEDSAPVLKSLYAIAREIHGDKFLRPLVDQVYIDNRKQVILVPKLGVHEIMLGDSTQLEDKIERLKIFYKEAISGFAWEKYRQMDLRYAGQVICR